MDTLTYRVKIRDVLFFTALAMISIAAHAFLLFGFVLSFQPLEKRAEKQLMKVGFVKRVRSSPEISPKFRPSAVPDPVVQERPKMKENQPLPPSPAPEEIELIEEAPEAFSQFLDELENAERVAEFEFKPDSYDILEDSAPIAAPDEDPPRDEDPSREIPGTPGKVLGPRVEMVVTRVPRDAGKSPPTYIETRFSQVKFPNIQIKRKDFQKGWLSVYFVISVDSRGRIEDIRRVRPREPDDLQMLFVDALLETVNTWTFDRKKSFIHVDVRFYVE